MYLGNIKQTSIMAFNFVSMPAEILVCILSIVIIIFILKHDSKYLGNRFCALSFFLYGCYCVVMFIAELGINEILIKAMVLSSLALIILATLAFIISMQIYLDGVLILRNKSIILLEIMTLIIVFLSLIWPNSVEVIDVETVMTKKSIFINILIGSGTILLMGYNLYKLKKGLETIPQSKKIIRIKITGLYHAQLIGLICPLWSILGNILVSFNPNIAIIFTSLIFVNLAIVMIKVALTLKR